MHSRLTRNNRKGIFFTDTNLSIVLPILINEKNKASKKKESTFILKQVRVLVLHVSLSFLSHFLNRMMLPLNLYKINFLCPQLPNILLQKLQPFSLHMQDSSKVTLSLIWWYNHRIHAIFWISTLGISSGPLTGLVAKLTCKLLGLYYQRALNGPMYLCLSLPFLQNCITPFIEDTLINTCLLGLNDMSLTLQFTYYFCPL